MNSPQTGSALTHHPHVHCIVPGGGLSLDGARWIPCKRGFFLPVRVLSRLFRRLFLEQLQAAHLQRRLQFYGQHIDLNDAKRFALFLDPLRQIDWVVYAKPPFAGPEAVLAYLSRYTHRVAISNQRLIAHDEHGVTFRWKDYRRRGRARYQLMTVATDEFIRRFLIHVLPSGFHRIRHYGLFASHLRRGNLARIRQCLDVPSDMSDPSAEPAEDRPCPFVCHTCGSPLRIIETLNPRPRAPPS